MSEQRGQHKVIIIGTGPAGLTAVPYIVQLKVKTAHLTRPSTAGSTQLLRMKISGRSAEAGAGAFRSGLPRPAAKRLAAPAPTAAPSSAVA